MLKKFTFAAVAIILVAMLISSLTVFAAPSGAPQFSVTPASTPIAPSSSPAQLYVFSKGLAITADTRWCFDAMPYRAVNLQWAIDQGTVNTTTLKLQFNNDLAVFPSTFVDGATIASANAADANSMNEAPIYGRHTCVLADVTNSNTITITAVGVFK